MLEKTPGLDPTYGQAWKPYLAYLQWWRGFKGVEYVQCQIRAKSARDALRMARLRFHGAEHLVLLGVVEDGLSFEVGTGGLETIRHPGVQGPWDQPGQTFDSSEITLNGPFAESNLGPVPDCQ